MEVEGSAMYTWARTDYSSTWIWNEHHVVPQVEQLVDDAILMDEMLII